MLMRVAFLCLLTALRYKNGFGSTSSPYEQSKEISKILCLTFDIANIIKTRIMFFLEQKLVICVNLLFTKKGGHYRLGMLIFHFRSNVEKIWHRYGGGGGKLCNQNRMLGKKLFKGTS